MNNLIKIENREGKLKLNDGVHKDSADKLIEELETLYGNDAVEAKMQLGEIVCCADNALTSVEVEINTNGGSVMEGQRIYNSLRHVSSRGVEVKTTVNGMAASMGSVILMAGDKRSMTHGSRIMIHEASTNMRGTAAEFRNHSEVLESISAEIAGIYAERAGGDAGEFREMMIRETYMDTVQAKELGFIHSVIKNGKESSNSAQVDIRDASPKNSSMSILSKLFPDKDEDLQIEAAASEIKSLRADNITAQERITALEGDVVSKDQIIAERAEALGVAEAAAAESSEKIETLEKDLEASQKETIETRDSVGKQVAEALNGIGQPAPLKIGAGSGDEQSAHDQYTALKSTNPAAATKFWNENKDAITAQR